MATQWPTSRLEHYYSKRWSISYQQLAQLDWHIYYKNYKTSTSQEQIYIIKLMTGWLPVYHRMNKMTHTKLYCPICQNDETVGHIFQCRGRLPWRQQFFSELPKNLRKFKTPPKVHQEIIASITNLITQETPTNQIYQFTIFAGLLPLQWTTRPAEQHLTHTAITHTTNLWAKGLSSWMTQQGHTAWIVRNKQIHKDDDSPTTIHHYLNNKIRQLYALQQEVGYHDRDMFTTPIEERLKLPEKQKMAWVSNTTKTMKVSMAEYHDKQTQGQKDIRKFFTNRKQSQ